MATIEDFDKIDIRVGRVILLSPSSEVPLGGRMF